MVYTLRFFPSPKCSLFHNSNYLVPVLFTFYIQVVLKLKKNNSGAKRLREVKSDIEKQSQFPPPSDSRGAITVTT